MGQAEYHAENSWRRLADHYPAQRTKLLVGQVQSALAGMDNEA